MILPQTTIHLTGSLITPNLDRILTDRVKRYHLKRLKGAPFCDIVGELTGYEVIKNETEAGGYCNYRGRIIALSDHGISDREVTHNSQNDPIRYGIWRRKLVCHEISHALQAEEEQFEKEPWLLSAKLHTEWQAESMAYRLYNACFGVLDYRYFSSYFSKKDVLWLREWYGEWIEDDLNIKL